MLCGQILNANMLLNAIRKPAELAFQILLDINLALASARQREVLLLQLQAASGTVSAVTVAMNRPAWTRARMMLERGSVRTAVLVVVFFCLGLAASTLWFHRSAKPVPEIEPGLALSPSTKEVLGHLNNPVEVRCYSILDPNSSPALLAFSGRVKQLLAAYQQAAPGKVTLNMPASADPQTALADGIKGFNLDKGEGCYLGVTLSSAGKKEVLAQLAPEWEQALEPDISRALQRVTSTTATQGSISPATPADTAAADSVRRDIPNLESVSLEDGIRILRESSLKEFTKAVEEMQAQVRDAQDRLAQARSSGSQSDQDAAMKQLQSVESANAERLKEIAANSQARVDALKKLKAGAK